MTAVLNAPFVFQDKAATLAGLEGRLKTARVLPQATITHAFWRANPAAAIGFIRARPWARERRRPSLIVRSCASQEDGTAASFAGHFVSVQHVGDDAALAEAIDAVFASYGQGTEDPEGAVQSLGLQEKVLIQPMLTDVVASGVATSREVGSGRPYIVVATTSGRDTTEVTGGRSNSAEVSYCFRGALAAPRGRDGAVVRLLREVEDVVGLSNLDIEFAFVADEHTEERRLVLLQARPLAAGGATTIARDRHCRLLGGAEDKVRQVLNPHPLARGRRSALAVMTDWNPAEMIGVRPRPLALSLYRRLITDHVWALQRNDFGYRDVRGFPLLIDVLGVPFIDVRASFESFIPAALKDEAADELADVYMGRLLADPSLHDKVEFEIVLSCYAFDIDDRLAALREAGASSDLASTLRGALHALTERVVRVEGSPRLANLADLVKLDARRARLDTAGLDPLAQAYWLLEDCRRFGTRAFAGLARVGFMAIELLNSMVKIGAIGEEDRRALMMGVSTVAGEMQQDLEALPRPTFLARYGHLRPGAYDILSPRYDEAPDLYFDRDSSRPAVDMPPRDVSLLQAGMAVARTRIEAALAKLLPAHRLNLEPKAVFEFIVEGVRERERAKFLFTRNLSDALTCLKTWGAAVGLSPEELSFADVQALRESYGSAGDPVDLFCGAIHAGREAYEVTAATCLPAVITDPADVWTFHTRPATPSFVTRRVARGPVVTELNPSDLAGAIVLIPNADPGFDWIFTHGVAGLITAYGGVNSHMAIRAAELDLPAVIGAGEQQFDDWARAGALKLDCANRRVERLAMGLSQ
jgi:hypothetical protein